MRGKIRENQREKRRKREREGAVIVMIVSWWSGSELGIGSVFLIGYGDDGDIIGWMRLG